uniref:Uncharacterized protein n=1 Tax=Nelumbo nucifera TaxID=4432 RepID=A0A822Y0S3_NELNU|nr:TPA_asm: hypothetical protein HUJ06_026575 [Nelumbo nucifera]
MAGVWQVEDMKDKKVPEGMRLRPSILVGGEPGKPGPKTARNWFKIEKVETKKPSARPGQHYRIYYCPNVCPQSCNVECGNIGVSIDDDTAGLGLSKGFLSCS